MYLSITGAREHNLKNIDVDLPLNSLVVITGVSGSGKSSLAFDTIYAEGQRRFLETYGSYVRQFLGGGRRPDVDKIEGLGPVIAIEQKTVGNSPRSTVGTMTEISDFLRLLYSRIGEAHSYVTGERMVKQTEKAIYSSIVGEYGGRALSLMAPLVRGRKGHYKELFERLMKRGYVRVFVDGKELELTPTLRLDRYKPHDISLVVDRIAVPADESEEVDGKRLRESIDLCLKMGKGIMLVRERDQEQTRYFSRNLMCPTTGIAYPDPAPMNFSFNSPQGACPTCKGLGSLQQIELRRLVPDPSKSIAQGAIEPLGKAKNSLIFAQIEALGKLYGFDLETPWQDISEEGVDAIVHGTSEHLSIASDLGLPANYFPSFDGVVGYISKVAEEATGVREKKWVSQWISTVECPECHGTRLNKIASNYFVAGKNIAAVSALDVRALSEWVAALPAQLSERDNTVASEILREMRARIGFLVGVGLDYVSLSRPTSTLSGGESQRIRLASQLGCSLVNLTYVLDEPSIGLHPRDNDKLIESLRELRDKGNTVLVVEHDRDMMLASDYMVEIGPGAGRLGGYVVAQGTPAQMAHVNTPTGLLIKEKGTGDQEHTNVCRRSGQGWLTLKGLRGNNLRGIDVRFPLATLICVTGVSGSGKSTIVCDTLAPLLAAKFHNALRDPLPYDVVEGDEQLDKVISIDQSPIGKTSRSNPATYTGVMDDIRKLFSLLPESKLRNYGPGHFSQNVVGGRCEHCKGTGVETIEMRLLPEVEMPCPYCRGKRYKPETLEVKYKGQSIGDVLDMTINAASELLSPYPQIATKLEMLRSIGVGYLTMGQSSPTLSGGEAQRIKLAAELARRDTGRTLFILDEPTTGLHSADIRKLLDILQRLVDKGNTVVVIEHNTEVMSASDWIIDVGPGGGREGGTIVAAGTPEDVARAGQGETARYLVKELGIRD